MVPEIFKNQHHGWKDAHGSFMIFMKYCTNDWFYPILQYPDILPSFSNLCWLISHSSSTACTVCLDCACIFFGYFPRLFGEIPIVWRQFDHSLRAGFFDRESPNSKG